jgi:hypothetical protein
MQSRRTHIMVLYHVAFRRTADDDSTDEPDPTPAELDAYVRTSTYILENPTYNIPTDYFIDPPHYVGNSTFKFVLKKHKDIKATQVGRDLLYQSFADGEWAASPGNGSFVYPDRNGERLGVLYYDSVIVNGRGVKPP